MSAKAKARLSDIEVKELSAVDNAANKRTFLIVKSEAGPAPADGDVPADAGAPPTADTGATPPPAPEGTPDNAGVEKRGAKMAKERLARFKASLEQLQKIVTELEGEVADMQDAGDAEKVAKADEPNPLQAKLDELTEQVAALTTKSSEQAATIADQTATIAKQAGVIRSAHVAPPSNSTRPEGITKMDKPFAWPADLNAERRSK